jgi:hypothetical protein
MQKAEWKMKNEKCKMENAEFRREQGWHRRQEDWPGRFTPIAPRVLEGGGWPQFAKAGASSRTPDGDLNVWDSRRSSLPLDFRRGIKIRIKSKNKSDLGWRAQTRP